MGSSVRNSTVCSCSISCRRAPRRLCKEKSSCGRFATPQSTVVQSKSQSSRLSTLDWRGSLTAAVGSPGWNAVGIQMHCRTECPVHRNDNDRPESRSLQRSCELGVITSFTVLESQFPVTRPTSWASCRPPPLCGSYPRRMDGCHRRLSLHRATPLPAAVSSFPHCCRPPLSPPMAAAAPAARRPLAAAAPAARPPLAAAVAAPGCHRRRHQPPPPSPRPAATGARSCRRRRHLPPPPLPAAAATTNCYRR